jgi:Domain of unknown function (DUF4145)
MDVHLQREPARTTDPKEISMRCPLCRQQGTLDDIQPDYWAGRIGGAQIVWGARRCPKEDCGALIQVVIDGAKVYSYPAETVDFDSTGLPAGVLGALQEAIMCHAHQCYVAGAIMVRKTLEEVCDDQGAQGGNLFARLEDLRGKVILPEAMFEGLHNLRLLGNDAVHIESQAFDQVDQEEVEVALEVTKEILKATYQYDSMMGRLAALKRAESEQGA